MREKGCMCSKHAFISKSCFSYLFYQLNYYYFSLSFSFFCSCFWKLLNDLDPNALSDEEENNVKVFFNDFRLFDKMKR